MTRCITFDVETAAVIRAHGINAMVQNGTRDALAAALAAQTQHSLVLMPSRSTGRVLLVRLNRGPKQMQALNQCSSVHYEAGGFLGLSDEMVYELESTRPTRWWRKLWE